MRILVVGASGATGRHVVEHLLNAHHSLTVLVRPTSKIPDSWITNSNVEILYGNISVLNLSEAQNLVSELDGIVCCLGHNLTLKGLFGKPRKLVRNAVALLCGARIELRIDRPLKFVLMNTTGNRHENEPRALAERLIIGIIRLLLPPHTDNEAAARFLTNEIGSQNAHVKWVVVRPDTLIIDNEVTPYQVIPSPSRSPIFNPGKTSKINVGHFMAELISNENLWERWQSQMPVIYNK